MKRFWLCRPVQHPAEYLSLADNVAPLPTDSKIHIDAQRVTDFCQQLVNFS
jgi:hypothetical protein